MSDQFNDEYSGEFRGGFQRSQTVMSSGTNYSNPSISLSASKNQGSQTGIVSLGNKEKKKKAKLQMKAPTQERSRQTVSTIIQACARVIVREGFFGVTTDRVAKEAGVSIGSLYQFFGNKESVVSAVIVDLFEKDLRFFQERVKNIESYPEDKRIERLLEIGFEIYTTEVELRSKIQNIYQYLVDKNYFDQLMRMYADVFTKYAPRVEGRDPRTLAYITVHGFVGLMESVIQDRPQFMNDASLKAEIMKLFTVFLKS